MNDRHAKIWLSVFVFTLMVVGSGASFFASQGKTFYKGLEPLRDVVSVSVLDAPTENNGLASLRLGPEDKKESAPEIQTAQESTIRTEIAIASPCPSGERPIIKNGRIESCGRHEEKKIELQKTAIKISAPLAPAPKVRILTEPSTAYHLPSITFPSCESRGLFTYTGSDRPGLLYGMCIDCLTNTYIMNGGKCL